MFLLIKSLTATKLHFLSLNNKFFNVFLFTFQLLLNLARSIFEEQTNLERLVTKIMKEAQGLLRCERCLVYLRDVPLMEAVSRIGKKASIISLLGIHSLCQSHIERILLMPSATGERKPLSRREVMQCFIYVSFFTSINSRLHPFLVLILISLN